MGPFEYLEHLRLAKEAVRIPVMASLNGATPGGWIEYARLMAQATKYGDATELPVKEMLQQMLPHLQTLVPQSHLESNVDDVPA